MYRAEGAGAGADDGKTATELTIGVALATFNGEAFLREQLSCLLRQDLPPHQVVIADDGSTDATRALIDEFARSAPFPTLVLKNNSPLGATKNFLKATFAVDADLIAFCDQDDLWRPNKLRSARLVFGNSKVQAAIHAYREIRELPIGETVEERRVRLPSRVVDGLLLAPILLWPGMSLIVRKSVLPAAMELRGQWQTRFLGIIQERPLAVEDYWCHMHDALLLNTARLLGSIAMIDQTLADHRLHTRNLTQTKKATWSQDADVVKSWGTSRVVPYRKLGQFCTDFSELLGRIGSAVLPEERNRDALAAYTRWAEIWCTRAELHVETARLSDRVGAFARLSRRRAYRSRLDGGLGVRSFIKDSAAVAGARIG